VSLTGKKVLVTGATGFIGTRLVEVLTQQERALVRALVHNYSNASRIARFPIEMIHADIADPDAVAKAAAGCDVIIHAAFGSSGDQAQQRAGTVLGTDAVMKAALAQRVSRVVHFSTISVYGMTHDGSLSENSPHEWHPDAYARFKAEAEEIALTYHRRHRLPVAVIQPTVVYGPFGGAWTVGPLNALHHFKLVVPDGGTGLCNAVYVDDVVQAALLAAVRPDAVGETFLISAEEPVTWREFYGAYAEMLEDAFVVGMGYREYRRASRFPRLREYARDLARLANHRGFQARVNGNMLFRTMDRLTRLVVPGRLRDWFLSFDAPATEKPCCFPDRNRFRWQQVRTRVNIDKARAKLGYAPQYDLASGMARTHAWAHWANLPGVVCPPTQHPGPTSPSDGFCATHVVEARSDAT
jgi:nucleoside-diphosphate-sugar epimerase